MNSRARGIPGTRKFRCQTYRPGPLCKGDGPGTLVHVHPLSGVEEAIVEACGLSCILQEGKGRGRHLEGREGGKLGGVGWERVISVVRAKGDSEVLQEEGQGKGGHGQ